MNTSDLAKKVLNAVKFKVVSTRRGKLDTNDATFEEITNPNNYTIEVVSLEDFEKKMDAYLEFYQYKIEELNRQITSLHDAMIKR